MRKIEFRGKRKGNGEWVYGDLVKTINGDYLIVRGFDHGLYFSKCPHIIPETVGQFTGLHDKNKKRIYEGDIIKGYDLYPPRGLQIAEVKYPSPETGLARWFTTGTGYSDCELDFWSEIEVVGNIHDNPELLEGV